MKSSKDHKLFIVTHCESCYNKRNIFTGRINSVLTPEGHQHAEELAKKLENERIDVAYISSLDRTMQTLKHILKFHPAAQIIVDDRIIERDYGQLSGKSKIKFSKDYPDLFPRYHRSYDVAPPGGESIKTVEDRVAPFVKEVLTSMRQNNINVLIVAHSNSLRPMIRYLENLTSDQMMQIQNIRHKIFTYNVLGGKIDKKT